MTFVALQQLKLMQCLEMGTLSQRHTENRKDKSSITGPCNFQKAFETIRDLTNRLSGLGVGLVVAAYQETDDIETHQHGLHGIFRQEIADIELKLLADDIHAEDAELVELPPEDVDDDDNTAYTLWHRACKIYADHGLRLMFRVPVANLSGGKGVVVLGTKNPETYNHRTDELLQSLARQIQMTVAAIFRARNSDLMMKRQQRVLVASLQFNRQEQINDILEILADTVTSVVGAFGCRIRLLDEDGNDFSTTICRTAHGECSQSTMSEYDDLVHTAIDRQQMVFDSVESDDDGDNDERGSVVVLPLQAPTAPIGAMTVQQAHGTEFTEHDLLTLQMLAADGAAAIHSMRLTEIARRRSDHMEVVAAQAWQEEARARALFEAATAVTGKTRLQDIIADVARSACREIGFDRAAVYITDHENSTLVGQLRVKSDEEPVPMQVDPIPLSANSGNPIARAALGSEPAVIDEVEREDSDQTYQRLLVPLTTQQQLVGIITADNRDSQASVSPQKTRLLKSLAGLVSVAIERARVQKLRGNLISAVSHELRTPLASIQAYNELVLEGDAGKINTEQKQFLKRVDESCGRLERLIDDLMHLSKLRSGEMPIEKQVTDIATTIRTVIDSFQSRAETSDISLEFKTPADTPDILTDEDRLRQVLSNLIDNALKFNEPGGWVRVNLDTRQDEVVISVADNGPGIPASHRKTIFDEFQHGTDDASRAKKGAGLGLSIAKRIVDLLDGNIWLDSEVGKGTTFYLSLPQQQ